MHWLELRIPPRFVAVATGAAMLATSAFGPRIDQPLALHWATAAAAAVCGGAITSLAAFALRRAGTTLLPMRPQRTSALVTSGIYGWSRHPMYLGLAVALMGWALYLSALLPLLGPVLFVAYVTRFQIQPEERALHAAFGPEYAAYARRVRQWI